METEKSECKGNICNHVLLVIHEMASKSEAIVGENQYDWNKMSQGILPQDLRAIIDRAKEDAPDAVAFGAFDDAWREVLEKDSELSLWFALKIWGLVLAKETEESPNRSIREDAQHAAKYLSDVAGVIEHLLSKRVH
jgi:hypothetical protein